MARTVCFIVRPEMTLQDIIVAMLMAKGGVCLDGMAKTALLTVCQGTTLWVITGAM